MVELNVELPKTPDNEWKDAQFRFDGAWLPDMDGTLIGPSNFQILENLRYKDSGLEGVNGYTKMNSTALSTYTYITAGHQLRSTHTQNTYTMVQAHSVSATGQGRVFLNRTSPGETTPNDGDFQTAAQVAAYTVPALDTSGNEYFEDASTGLDGRFSDAPQGNIAYCNGEQSMIFGGDEQRIAAAFQATETLGSEVIAAANDRTITVAHNWANGPGGDAVDAYSGTGGDITVTATAAGQYFTLAQGFAVTAVGTVYDLQMDVANLVGHWHIYDGSGAQHIGTITADGLQISHDFRATTTGGLRIVAGTATASGDFDNFTMKPSSHGDEIDVTGKLNNSLHLTSDDMITVDAATKNQIIVCTTRPAAGFKVYVDSGNENATASEVNILTYDGTGYQNVPIANDGTSDGGAALAQTGVITLVSHSSGTSKVHHEQGLYLYTYIIELSGGDADVYKITYNPAMQTIKDIWDGVYRQPIQFQVQTATASENFTYDYTLQVNASSDLNAPVGADLAGNGANDGGGAADDKVYIMFEDQMAAMKWTFLADKISNSATTMTMKYWDGDSWTAVAITDGTVGVATKSCTQSGIIKWTPPSDEVPQNAYGSFGYMYEIDFSAEVTETSANNQVLVDICTGIPAQLTVKPFAFSALYGTRLMLGGFSPGDEGNRMDYSVANAPDAFNGFDSSDNGKQSLYFGGVEPIVAATQIYNRFGSSIYTMLMVLKRNEVYIMTGDTPEDFTIYSVANTIGCVAPQTLATAEVGIDLGNGLTRSVAIWLSHSGPMMFDGAILTPLPGIKSYFDPVDDKYINFDYIKHAKGWVDPNYKEYNLLIPSGTSSTKNDVWLVYDLTRKKWFRKTTTNSELPQVGFQLGEPDTGQRYIYAGIDTGFLMQLEEGYTWGDGVSDSGIVQRIKTGDVFPSENTWDETLLRKLKIYMKRLTDSSLTNTLAIQHFQNTEPNADAGAIWSSYSPTNAGNVSWEDTSDVVWSSSITGVLNIQEGTSRVLRLIQDLNRKGWAHAFQYELTTSDVNKGFQPLSWGIQYRVERKDNTATG